MSTELQTDTATPSADKPAVAFVAVNFIHCESSYRERFEELFRTRAHAIDRLPGFIAMRVLQPQTEGGDYLVVSEWASRDAFDGWRQSPEFLEGHRRGFEDVRAAREAGLTPPMTSRFETYNVLCH